MITSINEFKLILEKFNFQHLNIDDYVLKCRDRFDYDEIIEHEFSIDDISELSEEDYIEKLTNIIAETFDDVIDDIYYCVEDEKIIYRAITVPMDFDFSDLVKKPLGIYWSYDKKSAEPHWGYDKNKQTILITASIQDTNDVDVEESIILNLDPSNGQEEKEIRMYAGRDVMILTIETSDDIIDVNRLGKT